MVFCIFNQRLLNEQAVPACGVELHIVLPKIQTSYILLQLQPRYNYNSTAVIQLPKNPVTRYAHTQKIHHRANGNFYDYIFLMSLARSLLPQTMPRAAFYEKGIAKSSAPSVYTLALSYTYSVMSDRKVTLTLCNTYRHKRACMPR